MPEVTWAEESEAGGDNMTHTFKITHTRTDVYTQTHEHIYSLPSLLAFRLKHKRTHWISSHSSWLEPPMAIAVGIHSPRMLGQLCWYWMRHSWFCLSLHAARDKNNILLNSNLCHLLPKSTQLISSLSPTPKRALNFFAKIAANLLPLMHGGPQSPADNQHRGCILLTQSLITRTFLSLSVMCSEIHNVLRM